MLLRATSAILAFLSGAYAIAIGPSANLYIVNKDIQPDGFLRPAVLAGFTLDGASFPGPLIKGYKGDRFRLNVINSLTDEKMLTGTSIHWHGIFQKGSSWADGAAYVTQCPILPEDSFLYDFTVPRQAGTFWYHSHLRAQYCDGLRGPLVIYDRQDPHMDLYDVDDESTIITIADWYATPAPDVYPTPGIASTLINGLGRRYPTEGTKSPLAVVYVTQGKRYRFRVVSMLCDGEYVFSIDRHPFTIIEADGVNTQPLEVDSIPIFAGQRYSIVVKADQTPGNYWIRARTLSNETMIDGINMAILRYDTARLEEPTTKLDEGKLMLETELHPLENPGAPEKEGELEVIRLNLEMDFNAPFYTINGVSFFPPTLPVLLQILSGAHPPWKLLPPGSVYILPRNKVIEVSIPGGSIDAPHPFHLHGHTFDVIRSAGNETYNYDNPVRRDVVSTGDVGDNVTFSFTTDNPGPWFLHCHVDWHLESGLAVVFAEDPGAIAHQDHPPEWDKLCPVAKIPINRPMSLFDTLFSYFY
ncbi:laccase [Tricholoma matsutake]|nr:laccase [Tricholoma matsutake 945]